MAFKYLSWVLFPLFVGYAIYSLIYNEHKGWYSFVLNMVYGFLLTFGMILSEVLTLSSLFAKFCFFNQLTRLHHDDTTTVHQLQAQIGGSFAMAHVDL